MGLAAVFEGFADWCVDSSPLYERLARGTAGDDALLDIVEAVPEGKSPPHLLLAGVHDLLLARADEDGLATGAGADLAQFYPTVVDDPVGVDAELVENEDAAPAGEDPFPPFRRFALEHAEDLRETFERRRAQTNSVRRCAALLPAFEAVSRELGGEPFALAEVGPSAGLNLRWTGTATSTGRRSSVRSRQSPSRAPPGASAGCRSSRTAFRPSRTGSAST